MRFWEKWAALSLIGIIRLYQKTLSPDHSWVAGRFSYGYCKFYPSCSEFAVRAIGRHGAMRGLWMGVGRIFRCNPWSRGGVDDIKESNQR